MKSMKKCISSIIIFVFLLNTSIAYGAFGDFSLADEERLGKQFSIFVKSSLPILYHPEIQEYLDGILNKITTPIKNTPYTFSIQMIQDPAVNAFATPGGHIFVHTGLVLTMDNENQLAGVIAHEVAHVTNRHIARRIERSQKVVAASLLAGLAGLALGPAGIGILLGSIGVGQNSMLYFSRLDESEADKAGMQYLVQAGYNPFGLTESFDKIRKSMIHKGIGSAPIYISTHPNVLERVQSTRTQAETFSNAIQKRTIDNSSFKTIQTLIRARHDIPERAMSIFNKENSCIYTLGKAIVTNRMKKRQESKKLFSEALACSPEYSVTYREAGIASFENKEYDEARTLLIQAIIMDNKDYYAMYYLARLYSEEKNHAGSQQLFSTILKKLPEDAEVHYYYGRELASSGKEAQGYIHLAYSSIYRHKLKQAQHFIAQAKQLASINDEEGLQKVEALYKEREQYFLENNIPLQLQHNIKHRIP